MRDDLIKFSLPCRDSVTLSLTLRLCLLLSPESTTSYVGGIALLRSYFSSALRISMFRQRKILAEKINRTMASVEEKPAKVGEKCGA